MPVNELEPHVYLFTDGSCATTLDSPGSWGAVVMDRKSTQLLCGCASPTTISRCELHPVIEGLRYIRDVLLPRAIPAGYRVLLISDSEYVIKTIGGLYEARKNEDLWSAYRHLAKDMTVQALYRSRNSHPLMNLADSMAYSTYKVLSEHLDNIRKSVGAPSFHILETMPVCISELEDQQPKGCPSS
jgi:ribonuclease HI